MKKSMIPLVCHIAVIIAFFLNWIKVDVLFAAYDFSAYKLLTSIQDMASMIQRFSGTRIEEVGFIYFYWLMIILPTIAIVMYLVGNKTIYRNVSIGSFITNLALIFGPAGYLFFKESSVIELIMEAVQFQIGFYLAILASGVGLVFVLRKEAETVIALPVGDGMNQTAQTETGESESLFKTVQAGKVIDKEKIESAKKKMKASYDGAQDVIRNLSIIQWGYVALGVYTAILLVINIREHSLSSMAYGVVLLVLLVLAYKFVPMQISKREMDKFFIGSEEFLSQFVVFNRFAPWGQNLMYICLGVFLVETLIDPHGLGQAVILILYTLAFFVYVVSILLLLSKGETSMIFTGIAGLMLIQVLGLVMYTFDYRYIWFMKLVKILLLWVASVYLHGYKQACKTVSENVSETREQSTEVANK